MFGQDESAVKIIVRAVDEFTGPLKGIESQLQGFSQSVGSAASLGGIGAVVGIGLLAVSKLKDGFIDLVETGSKVQQSFHDIKMTLEGQGKSWDELGDHIEGVVQALHASTRFDDEDIRNSLTNLIQLTGKVGESEKSLSAIADLAAARHISFAEAANGVARAVEGQERALRSAGIIFGENDKKLFALMTTAERFEFIQSKIEARFSDARLKDMENFTAQWDHLKNAAHDFKEQAGEPVAEVLAKILGRVNESIPRLKEFFKTLATGSLIGTAYGYGDVNGRPGASTRNGLAFESDWDLMQPIARAGGIAPGEQLGGTPFQYDWPAKAKEILDRAKTAEWKSEIQKAADALLEVQKNFELTLKATGSEATAIAAMGGSVVDATDKAVAFGVHFSDSWADIARAAAKSLTEQKTDVGKLAEEYQKLLDRIAKSTRPLSPKQSQGVDEAFFGSSVADAERDVHRWVEEYIRQMKEANGVLARDFAQKFEGPLSSMFGDLFTTGGKNFGDIVTQYLGDLGKQFGVNAADAITNLLGQAFGKGAAPEYRKGYGWVAPGSAPGTQGSATAGDYWANAGGGNQEWMQAAQQGLAVGAGAYAIASQAQAGTITPMSGALIGLQAGSTFGAVGAAIGLVVGAAIGAILESEPVIEQYARPQIHDGMAKLTDVMGLSDADQRDYLQQIQAQWDTFKNGYVNIFLAMPKAVRDQVMPLLRSLVTEMSTGQFLGQGGGIGSFYQDANGDWHHGTPTGGPPVGGLDFQSPINSGGEDQTTPGVFKKWMGQWINGTLPQAMMEQFQPAFQKAFGFMGVTVEKFHEIWKTAEGMDPKLALQYLTSYAEVVGTMTDILKKLSTPIGFGTGGSGLWAQTMADNARSFVESLNQSGADIVEFGKGLELLTGQAQIDGARQLNQMITSRYEDEKRYIQQLVQMVNTARDQLYGNQLTLSLAGKTPKEQYAILQGSLNTLEQGFGHETTATQLTTDYNRIVQLVMSMAGMFPNDARIQQWASGQLTSLEQNYETFINKLGNALDSANNQFTADLQPVVNLFTTTLNTASDIFSSTSSSVASLDAAAKSATGSVLSFGAALDAVTAKMADSAYAASVRRSRGLAA